MTKRIDELFGKALDEAVPETWTVLNPEQLSRLKTKFAELIVRECATICKDTAEKQFNPLFSRESDGADVCYRKIKEHFGVTE